MASAAVRQRGVAIAAGQAAGPTFLQPLQLKFQSSNQPARRTMSMVTKTKVSELAKNDNISDNGAPSIPSSSSIPSQDAVMNDVLIVTPSCMQRVEQLVSQKDIPSYLRVYVDAGGCSGFSYKFEIDSEELQEDDIVVHQVKKSPWVVIDEASLEFLKGSKIDYVQEMIKSAFVVLENPQSESACGCGSSFAVKNFSSNPAVD
jgi:iron-sulfur cluster assembly accessory protein